jgi:hypothetical protein
MFHYSALTSFRDRTVGAGLSSDKMIPCRFLGTLVSGRAMRELLINHFC